MVAPGNEEAEGFTLSGYKPLRRFWTLSQVFKTYFFRLLLDRAGFGAAGCGSRYPGGLACFGVLLGLVRAPCLLK